MTDSNKQVRVSSEDVVNLEILVGGESRRWVGYLDNLLRRTRTDLDLRWLKEIDVCVYVRIR